MASSAAKVIWESEWKPKGYETFNTQRGAAIKDGKIVRAQRDLCTDRVYTNSLIALDVENGLIVPAKWEGLPLPPRASTLVVAGAHWRDCLRLGDHPPAAP
jgi:outer membrane protein assembly factor BamB